MSNNYIYLIVFIIICLIVITYKLFYVHVYEFTSPSYRNGDPTLCIIGSVHGNEPAGTLALEEMIRAKLFEHIINSRVIVILNPNPIGLMTNNRESWNFGKGWFDINRSYNTSRESQEPQSAIIKQIQECVMKSNLVLEFHEGWGFHKINPSSLGSTIMPTKDNLATNLGYSMLSNINKHIHDQDKHFSIILNDACGITSCLGCYCEKRNIPHILLEITGQNDKQPIEIRKKQVSLLIRYAMQHLHIV